MKALQQHVEASRARAKEIWRMSCEQVEEFDQIVPTKDQKIAQLRRELTT